MGCNPPQSRHGVASAGFDTIFLNDDEMRVQHFHNELDQLLADQE
ncbi:MAG: hypothetical protein VB949_13195 [Pseudomonadales bacterium]